MKWKDLTQRFSEATKSAIETAQQVQHKLNTAAISATTASGGSGLNSDPLDTTRGSPTERVGSRAPTSIHSVGIPSNIFRISLDENEPGISDESPTSQAIEDSHFGQSLISPSSSLLFEPFDLSQASIQYSSDKAHVEEGAPSSRSEASNVVDQPLLMSGEQAYSLNKTAAYHAPPQQFTSHPLLVSAAAAAAACHVPSLPFPIHRHSTSGQLVEAAADDRCETPSTSPLEDAIQPSFDTERYEAITLEDAPPLRPPPTASQTPTDVLSQTLQVVPRHKLEMALESALRKLGQITQQLKDREVDVLASHEVASQTTQKLALLQDKYDNEAVKFEEERKAFESTLVAARTAVVKYQAEVAETKSDLMNIQKTNQQLANANEELKMLKNNLSEQLEVLAEDSARMISKQKEMLHANQNLITENQKLVEKCETLRREKEKFNKETQTTTSMHGTDHQAIQICTNEGRELLATTSEEDTSQCPPQVDGSLLGPHKICNENETQSVDDVLRKENERLLEEVRMAKECLANLKDELQLKEEKILELMHHHIAQTHIATQREEILLKATEKDSQPHEENAVSQTHYSPYHEDQEMRENEGQLEADDCPSNDNFESAQNDKLQIQLQDVQSHEQQIGKLETEMTILEKLIQAKDATIETMMNEHLRLENSEIFKKSFENLKLELTKKDRQLQSTTKELEATSDLLDDELTPESVKVKLNVILNQLKACDLLSVIKKLEGETDFFLAELLGTDASEAYHLKERQKENDESSPSHPPPPEDEKNKVISFQIQLDEAHLRIKHLENEIDRSIEQNELSMRHLEIRKDEEINQLNNDIKIRLNAFQQQIKVLESEKVTLEKEILDLNQSVRAMAPPPPPPPPVQQSATDVIPLLFFDLLQFLETQTERLNQINTFEEIEMITNSVDMVIQTIEERLPDIHKHPMGSGVKKLYYQILELAKGRLHFTKQIIKLQQTHTTSMKDEKMQQKIQFSDSPRSQTAAAVDSMSPTTTAQRATTTNNNSMLVKSISSLEVETLKKEKEELEISLEASQSAQTKLAHQCSRFKELVTQTNSQLMKSREASQKLKNELEKNEVEFFELNKNYNELQTKLDYRNKPPTLTVLKKLNLESKPIMKVAIMDQIWCCLSTSSSTAAATPESSAPSPKSSDETPGISWWRVDDLEDDLLRGSDLITLQEQHFHEMNTLQTLITRMETKTQFLEKRLKHTTLQFEEYKQKVSILLSQKNASPEAPLPTMMEEPPLNDVYDKSMENALLTRLKEETERLGQALQKISLLEEQIAALELGQEEYQLHLIKEVEERASIKCQEEMKKVEERMAETNFTLQHQLEAAYKRIQNLTSSLIEEKSIHASYRESIQQQQQQQSPLKQVSGISSVKEANSVDYELQKRSEKSSPERIQSIGDHESSNLSQQDLSESFVELADLGHFTMQGHQYLKDFQFLKKRIQILEHRLSEERRQVLLLLEQNELLKKEFRKSEALLQIQLKVMTKFLEICAPMSLQNQEQSEVMSGIPLEFIRNTIIKFIETDQLGSDEHETLIPVLTSIFAFTRDEMKKIEQKRHQQVWLPTFFSSRTTKQ